MPTPNKEFRENPSRSIYIGERFTDELLRRLTPELNKLRLACGDPITVYINSPGGSTEVGDLIKRLLKTPDQDGAIRRMITVATNEVASAAADLLIAGDYSMAYEHARIHYHGTRIPGQTVTNEAAAELAQMLSLANSYYAERLARVCIYNIAFIASVFSKRIAAETTPPGFVAHFESIGKLSSFLSKQLSADNRNLITSVNAELVEHQALSIHLMEKLEKHQDGAKKDLRTLKLIIDWKHRELDVCSVDETFLNRVQKSYIDFLRLDRKIFEGEFGRIFQTIGPTLLQQSERLAYDAASETERVTYLRDHAFVRFFPLYLFTNTLAHRLQRGENQLSAKDAYWLGLINEVVGSSLPCMRDLAEASEEPELPLGSAQTTQDTKPAPS